MVEPRALAAPEMAIGATSWTEGLREVAEAEIAGEAKRIAQSGVATETRVLVGGATHLVLETARELRPRLIVVGTHGRSGTARLFLGSVSEQVVRSSPCPVLVTREGAADPGRWSDGRALRLVVAADGTPSLGASFTWLGSLESAFVSDVTVVRVYWPQESFRYGVEESWQRDQGNPELLRFLERDLQGQIRAATGDGLAAPRLRLRPAGADAAAALVDEAQSWEPDALVLAVPQHRPWRAERWTAVDPRTVLRAASMPVFCVPDVLEARRHEISQVRSVLIATDLSDLSREAILPAYGLLHAAGERVELCYVHVQSPTSGAGEVVLPTEPLGPMERAEIESQLRALVPPEAEQLGITTSVSVIEGRSPKRSCKPRKGSTWTSSRSLRMGVRGSSVRLSDR